MGANADCSNSSRGDSETLEDVAFGASSAFSDSMSSNGAGRPASARNAAIDGAGAEGGRGPPSASRRAPGAAFEGGAGIR